MMKNIFNVLVKLLAINYCLMTVTFGAEVYPIKENEKAQMEIDAFIAVAVKDKEKRELLVTDYSAIVKALALPSEELSNQLLLSVFKSKSQVDFYLKKASWVTVAKINRNESVISSSMMLAGLKQKLQLKAMIDMMSRVDEPENEGAWDFDCYQPVLEANENEMFLRLVTYMFEKSPPGAINYYLKNYAEDFTQEERKTVAMKTNRASSEFIKYGSSIKYEKETVEDVVSILLDLVKYEKWYLDAYVAIMLKNMRLDNVSPELSKYINSKQGSLAYKIRNEKQIIYSSSPQLIDITKIMAAQKENSRKSASNTRNGRSTHSTKPLEKPKLKDNTDNAKSYKGVIIAVSFLSLGLIILLFLIKRRRE